MQRLSKANVLFLRVEGGGKKRVYDCNIEQIN